MQRMLPTGVCNVLCTEQCMNGEGGRGGVALGGLDLVITSFGQSSVQVSPSLSPWQWRGVRKPSLARAAFCGGCQRNVLQGRIRHGISDQCCYGPKTLLGTCRSSRLPRARTSGRKSRPAATRASRLLPLRWQSHKLPLEADSLARGALQSQERGALLSEAPFPEEGHASWKALSGAWATLRSLASEACTAHPSPYPVQLSQQPALGHVLQRAPCPGRVRSCRDSAKSPCTA